MINAVNEDYFHGLIVLSSQSISLDKNICINNKPEFKISDNAGDSDL